MRIRGRGLFLFRRFLLFAVFVLFAAATFKSIFFKFFVATYCDFSMSDKMNHEIFDCRHGMTPTPSVDRQRYIAAIYIIMLR